MADQDGKEQSESGAARAGKKNEAPSPPQAARAPGNNSNSGAKRPAEFSEGEKARFHASEELKANARELFESGATYRKIAEVLNRSVRTIKNWSAEAGGWPRKTGKCTSKRKLHQINKAQKEVEVQRAAEREVKLNLRGVIEAGGASYGEGLMLLGPAFLQKLKADISAGLMDTAQLTSMHVGLMRALKEISPFLKDFGVETKDGQGLPLMRMAGSIDGGVGTTDGGLLVVGETVAWQEAQEVMLAERHRSGKVGEDDSFRVLLVASFGEAMRILQWRDRGFRRHICDMMDRMPRLSDYEGDGAVRSGDDWEDGDGDVATEADVDDNESED